MLCLGCMAFAQTADPVVMRINGQPVPRSEFEYSYNKNNAEGVIDKKTVEEYVDLFVNYKMKVQAALDAKLDTMASYKKEFLQYRDQQVRPSFVTEEGLEQEARQIYETTKEAIGPRGLIKPAHILLLLNQKATEEEQQKVKQRIDSIYNALLGGADFAEMAKKYSQDPGSAQNGGAMRDFVGPNRFVKEFEDAAYELQVGEMSKPVQSPYGWHIIQMLDRKQLDPYDTLRADIMRFIDARGIRDHVAQTAIDTLAKERGITPEQLLDERAAELSAQDMETKYLIKEYHDGLLLFEISNRIVWEKAAKDTLGLENYFKAHKKDYNWDEPRYKGMVYHVKEKADVKAVRNSVKKLSFDKWADKLRRTFNNDSIIRIRVEKGIFKKGDNAFIDSMVFKKDTVTTAVKGYPIDAVYGKLLKKGPETWDDVKGQVTADYQDQLEKQWVAELRKRYTVEVDEKVLKTVNNH